MPGSGWVVITGASRGLGAALARLYAAPGVKLALTARSAEPLEAVAAQCRDAGAQVETAALDVAEAEPLGAWLLSLEQSAPIELMIANAGTSGGPAPGEASEGLALASRQVRTNLLGAMNAIEPVAPLMAARGRGGVAVIASIAALRGLPYSPAYCASKAGVRAYGESLRPALAPFGVAVTVVCPGFFDSAMTERFKGHTPLLCSTERAAAIVKRGVDRRAARVEFPWLLVLGLRLADLIPTVFGDWIMRDIKFHITADRS